MTAQIAAGDVLSTEAIYDGLKYRGEVKELKCGMYEAIDVDGEVIGVFDDARVAFNSVLARGCNG